MSDCKILGIDICIFLQALGIIECQHKRITPEDIRMQNFKLPFSRILLFLLLSHFVSFMGRRSANLHNLKYLSTWCN